MRESIQVYEVILQVTSLSSQCYKSQISSQSFKSRVYQVSLASDKSIKPASHKSIKSVLQVTSQSFKSQVYKSVLQVTSLSSRSFRLQVYQIGLSGCRNWPLLPVPWRPASCWAGWRLADPGGVLTPLVVPQVWGRGSWGWCGCCEAWEGRQTSAGQAWRKEAKAQCSRTHLFTCTQ